MENEAQSMRQQVDQKLVDLRNEAIVQAATAYDLGHRVVRTSVGTVFLGVDQVTALFQRAAERGEKVEIDVQQSVDALRQRATQTASNARSEASTRSTAAVSSGVASLLNKLPGVSIVYKAPSATQPPADGEDGQAATKVSETGDRPGASDA
jgi:hypothetical protein